MWKLRLDFVKHKHQIHVINFTIFPSLSLITSCVMFLFATPCFFPQLLTHFSSMICRPLITCPPRLGPIPPNSVDMCPWQHAMSSTSCDMPSSYSDMRPRPLVMPWRWGWLSFQPTWVGLAALSDSWGNIHGSLKIYNLLPLK